MRVLTPSWLHDDSPILRLHPSKDNSIHQPTEHYQIYNYNYVVD